VTEASSLGADQRVGQAAPDGLVRGDDGLLRCPWGHLPEDYREYHDREWGRVVRGDDALFERLSLEAFQAGLSWLTILRRRAGFRAAFADFHVRTVAAYDVDDIDRLVEDDRIIRHRGKIEAVIGNARVLAEWQDAEGDDVLDALVWSLASDTAAPRTMADVPVETPASRALTRELKGRGWRFLGPTSAYAALQAVGVVDDHLWGCHARGPG
jgi:DNA-3-methyladenine glycosylase I